MLGHLLINSVMKVLLALAIIGALFTSQASAQSGTSNPAEKVYLHCLYEFSCKITIFDEAKTLVCGEPHSDTTDFIIDKGQKTITEGGGPPYETFTETSSTYTYGFSRGDAIERGVKEGKINRQTGSYAEDLIIRSQSPRTLEVQTKRGKCDRVDAKPKF